MQNKIKRQWKMPGKAWGKKFIKAKKNTVLASVITPLSIYCCAIFPFRAL